MNKESKKLTWAVGLVAGLGVLSIAYAALSSTLNINGNTTVDIGTVRFIAEGEENYTDKGCKVFGIGSTNPEYINGTSMSDTIAPPGGASSSRGLITSNFDTNIAKALVSQPGTLTLNDATADKKEKDTVTISDVKLNDYGSFVVYKLDIVNTSSNDMALVSVPNISVTKKAGSIGEDKIEAGLYQSCDSTNFATPCGEDSNKVQSVPKSGGGGGSSSAVVTKQDASSYNYLKPSATATWYLRIGFKNYSADNNTIGTASFDFNVSPRWEAVM